MGRFGRKRLRLWMAVLLPGLLLRLLTPVGFMPMFGPGFSAQIVLCEGYAPVPRAPSSSMDMPMGMPMDMPMDASMVMSVQPPSNDAAKPGSVSPERRSRTPCCLYGSIPSLGVLPAVTALPAVYQRSAELSIPTAQVDTFELLARAQSPRGPPLA
jgi:hypothetical protein